MNRQSGQAMVSALVSLAVMGISVAVMTSIVQVQNRENQALSEKLAALDLQKALIAAMADGSVCKYVLNESSLTVSPDQSPTPAAPIRLSLPSSADHPAALYAFAASGPPPRLGPAVAQVDQPASLLSNSLVVKSIRLELTGGSGNTYAGNWLVDFDEHKTIRAIKPAAVSTTVTVNSSGAVVGCMGGADTGPSNVASGTWCGAFTSSSNSPPQSIVPDSQIVQVAMPCGTPPSCNSSPGGSWSRIGGLPNYNPCYATNSLCPNGYSLKQIMTTSSFTPGARDVFGETPAGATTYSTLYTCTPN
jgi:hypothetical protein